MRRAPCKHSRKQQKNQRPPDKHLVLLVERFAAECCMIENDDLPAFPSRTIICYVTQLSRSFQFFLRNRNLIPTRFSLVAGIPMARRPTKFNRRRLIQSFAPGQRAFAVNN